MVLNPLASSKLEQMAKGIDKLKCARMRSTFQWYWFSNKILSKNCPGTQELERLHRLHPSGCIWMQPRATWSERTADLVWAGGWTRDTSKVPCSQNYPMSLIQFFFLGHSTPTFQPHSTITRAAQVLKKSPASLTWNCHVPTSFLVLHTKLSKSWVVTTKSPKLTMLLNQHFYQQAPQLLWWRVTGFTTCYLPFLVGASSEHLYFLLSSQLTLLQAMEKYRGSEISF